MGWVVIVLSLSVCEVSRSNVVVVLLLFLETVQENCSP